MSSLELQPRILPAARTRAAQRVGIAGLGVAMPEGSVSTATIAERVGVEPEWITRRTGIHARRHLAPGATIADLGEQAARAALAEAGIGAGELDAVLVATASADEVMPCAAPLIAGRIGAGRAMAWDVNLACTGFLAGLEQGAALIESGRATNVLVIAAEALSRVTDHADRKTAALFGDGAGAVVLGADGEGAVGPIILRADGSLAEAIVATHEERFLRMDGHSTFQAAVKVLTESTKEACRLAGRRLDDIDLFVYHQANGRILRAVAERLDVPPARVADYIGETGNTSAASIPLTMSLAREDGRLRAGHQVLVGAVGGGFTWGAGVIEWGLP
jgi:3-oxoacyl-[acyl-carrier-protein] synthase III